VVKLAITLCALLLAGCAGGSYRTEPLPVEPDRGGVVEDVRSVPLGDRGGSIAGTIVGGSVGAVAGSGVGSGRGSQAASVAGAVAGTIAGNVLASGASTREGLEITVRLDSGRQILVVQGGAESFKPGDRVRVVSDGRFVRVTR
jgi:outer membrane lipoprotein SlyB